jgi:DNA mismatch repair protein MutS2
MPQAFNVHPLEFDKIIENLARYALTDMALEKINALAPDDDLSRIENALSTLVEMADALRYDDTFPIDDLKDIRTPLRKLNSLGTFLNPDQLKLVRLTLETSRRIRSYIKSRMEKYPLLERMTQPLHVFSDIEKTIASAIDDHGEIKDNASPRLRQIRRDIVARSAHVRKRLEVLAKTYAHEGFASDAIVTVREGRMVIPIKEEYKNAVKGFIHDESASGQTVFIEPAEALELNNEVRKLLLDDTREVERILMEIADRIRIHLSDILADLEILGSVEYYYAKGRFANQVKGIKPNLNSEGYIKIRNGYHPLLWLKELNRLKAEQRTIVPLNLEIGREFRTIIISGPNAGGKTVALKTIGLFVLMAQSGLLIPAESGTHLSVFRQVFADIGDDQSIENDLSTFSSHVQHLARMAEHVTSQTLILIDEIGSGTDPKEGASLAIALLDFFNSRRAVSLVTTHHGELKAFAHDTRGIENASMEFDQDTLTPTYVFRQGIPGSSYAFEISKRIGLPEQIIRRAKEISGTEAQRLENLIQNLQAQTKHYDELLAAVNRDKSGIDGMTKFYNDRIQELKMKEKAFRQKFLEEKQQALWDANKKIEALLHEIRESQAEKDVVKSSRNLMQDELKKVQTELAESKEMDSESHEAVEIKEGQRVYIKNMDLEGTIVSGSGDHVVVSVGAIRIKLSADQLVKATPRSEKKVLPKQTVEWNTDDIKNELDLRGFTAEEALYEVDKYLTDAQILGFREVTIVHGKGDGILRKKIGEFLKRDQRITAFRLGQWGEGDTGVTVVALKTD